MIWTCLALIVVTIVLLAGAAHRKEVERCETWIKDRKRCG